METKFSGEFHRSYGPVVSDLLKEVGKRSADWDLNCWRWDGDRFMATPLSSVPCDQGRNFPPIGPSNAARSHGASDEVRLKNEGEKRDLEKRNRDFGGCHADVYEGAEPLNLNLGEQVYPIVGRELEDLEVNGGKRTKVSGVVCQVEGCATDLSYAKDYHRRHKVCEFHSKASSSLVGNVTQRFCQQCSRFHLLEEFDEGKRSCRRRLAGHNKRRRKTHPENSSNNDENGIQPQLIAGLIRILSDIHSNNSDNQTKGEGLISHMLRNLVIHAGVANDKNLVEVPPVPRDVQKELARHSDPGSSMPASNMAQRRIVTDNDLGGILHDVLTPQSATLSHSRANDQVNGNDSETVTRREKLNGIDLNSICDDDSEDLPNTVSAKHSRTDRIVLKLFGKDPSDLPPGLRKQILDWLSNSPTDIESFIRPGCIMLTIYLRMDESNWEELYCNLTSSLRRLLDLSTDSFWRTGWICACIQDHVAFTHNGHLVLNAPLSVRNPQSFKISSIKPIAVAMSEEVQFVVRGCNFSLSTSRLLCSLEGKYLLQENCIDNMTETDSSYGPDVIESLSFRCVIPNIVGRGFVEVEDYGLSSSFFPFIVAEKNVCSEICSLESIIEACEDDIEDANNLELRNQALDYIHEFGWLLHRNRLRSGLGKSSDDKRLFPFKRFKWLIEFSVDHDWQFTAEKLLNILSDGTVDLGPENNLRELLDIGLLHRAVKRNCRSMVEFLLRYSYPSGPLNQPGESIHLFRPDSMGPCGTTPLHIAAGMDNYESMVDALTEDPGMVGIIAWEDVKDGAGLTPHNIACFSGHYSYIHLVQRKLNKKLGSGHVVIDVPGTFSDKQKIAKPAKYSAFESDKKTSGTCEEEWCRQCEQKSTYVSSLRVYRPTMVSMVAIAAVCVCTALLFKTMPVVVCSFMPFRWELLKYGYQ